MAKAIETQADLDELFEWAKDAGYPYMGDKWTLNLDDGGETTVTDTFEADGEYEGSQTVRTLEELHESIFCWRHDC